MASGRKEKRLPPSLDRQLIVLYQRLEQVQWSLLCQQRRVGRLVEQQRRRLEEQDRLIAHLSHRLANHDHPGPEVEEVEKIALARLPSLAEEEVEVEQKKKKDMEETGDGDSAIHLDCVQEGAGQFDSSDDFQSPNSSPRRLQRSVSDVVGCQMMGSRRRYPGGGGGGGAEECFPSPLYRGFLLRHQRRQRESREADRGREAECHNSDFSDPGHLAATETYNVMNNCPKIRHIEDRNWLNGRNCTNLEHFESRSKSIKALRNCHLAPSLSIPVVRQDDMGGGRAKKKTTIIIGNP